MKKYRSLIYYVLWLYFRFRYLKQGNSISCVDEDTLRLEGLYWKSMLKKCKSSHFFLNFRENFILEEYQLE